MLRNSAKTIYDREEKMQFLQKCHDNIMHIWNKYYIAADGTILNQHIKDKYLNYPRMKKTIHWENGLPKGILFSGWLSNVKMGKLYILIDIYNGVSCNIRDDKPLNFDELFDLVKKLQQPSLLDKFALSTEETICKRRRYFHEIMYGDCKEPNFAAPSSKAASFLEEHGFFKTPVKTDISPELENIRNCI